jgi:hypothetical protein
MTRIDELITVQCDSVRLSRVYYIGFKGDMVPSKEGTNKLEEPAAYAVDTLLVPRTESEMQRNTSRGRDIHYLVFDINFNS